MQVQEIGADNEVEDNEEDKVPEIKMEDMIEMVPKPVSFVSKCSTPFKSSKSRAEDERNHMSALLSQSVKSVKSNYVPVRGSQEARAIPEVNYNPFVSSQRSKPSPKTASKADVVMEDDNQSLTNAPLRRSERIIAMAEKRPFTDEKERDGKKRRGFKMRSKEETKKPRSIIPNDILGRIRSCVIPKDQNLITLESVKGNEDVKKAIKINIIYPKVNPKIFAKTRPAKTILLYGPPGNGKTMCAQAIANEIGWTFINVHTAMMMSKMFGESERIMNYLFQFAHDNQPCILFFDEIDAVLSCRSTSSNESSNRIVSVFLQNVGGITSITNDEIILIGATNFVDSLDPAVKRRFEYKLEVTLPSKTVIRQVLKQQMEEINYEITQDEADRLVDLLDGYCIADVINICNLATKQPFNEICTQELPQLSMEDIRSIKFEDFVRTIETHGKSYELSSQSGDND